MPILSAEQVMARARAVSAADDRADEAAHYAAIEALRNEPTEVLSRLYDETQNATVEIAARHLLDERAEEVVGG